MKFNLHKTLRGRFLTITLCMTITIVVGTSLLSYIMFAENLKNNRIHSAETNLQFLRNKINGYLIDIDELAQWSQQNEYIQNYINTASDNDRYPALANAAHERLTEAYISNSASAYISRVIIANVDSTKYLQRISNTVYSVDKNMVKIIRELPYYEELINGSTFHFSIGVQQEPFLLHNPDQMLPVIQPIYSPYNNNIIGFCYIQISFDMFTDPLKEYSMQERVPVFLTIADETYKIQNNSIRKLDSKFKTVPVDTDGLVSPNTQVHETVGNPEKILYISSSLRADGCYISIPISLDTSMATISGYLMILGVIFLVVILMGIFLYIFLSRTVGYPVKILKGQLQQIAQGNFTQNPEIEWDNEFGELGRNVNQLATDIKQMMEQRITFENQKKDYEYQMLQSQINPHFLYNTLNSIKWMAIAQRANGIAEMTTALAHLLKSISKGTTTLVSIRDELELLNDYFTIQKYRYGGAITMEYKIDAEDLLDNQILRFTLQPIVENAIFHGIEPKGQSGTIIVHIYQENPDTMQIDITDNGVGMAQEAIEQVLTADTSDSSSFFRQIGIRSVNKRIQYNFGMEYGISIESELGHYTTMKILLPAKSAQKKENK